MKKSGSFHQVIDKRDNIASALDTDPVVKHHVNKDYKTYNDGPVTILDKYMTEWKSRFSKEARLGKLLNIFDNCGLKDLSDQVRDADFYVKATQQKILDDEKKTLTQNVLPAQQQNVTYGQSQLNMNRPTGYQAANLPGFSSQIDKFEDVVPANELLQHG